MLYIGTYADVEDACRGEYRLLRRKHAGVRATLGKALLRAMFEGGFTEQPIDAAGTPARS